MNHWVGKLF